MQPIAPHLWFDTQAREAAERYVSLIPNSRIKHTGTLHDTPSGDTDVISFELAGRPFMAISAGPLFKVNPSISFHVKLARKEDVDALWNAMIEGGHALMPLGAYPFNERFGWLADRYGVSWQIMVARPGEATPAVVPALMFTAPMAGKAEEALNYYTAVFHDPGPQILMRYGQNDSPDREGTVQFATFTLNGQGFAAMDSAHPHGFRFNEAVSFVVPCDSQKEIDYYWSKLSAVPEAEQCGWCKDKFGLSWQVTPAKLFEMMANGTPAQVGRLTQAFLQMKKMDLAALERAYLGEP